MEKATVANLQTFKFSRPRLLSCRARFLSKYKVLDLLFKNNEYVSHGIYICWKKTSLRLHESGQFAGGSEDGRWMKSVDERHAAHSAASRHHWLCSRYFLLGKPANRNLSDVQIFSYA
jgi:hypothetical protein